MQAVKHGLCSVFLAFAVGCGAPDPGEALEPATAEELARIEFGDGNVVIFERLGDGILVSEHGPSENLRHFQPESGFSALEAFQMLAPEREVPPALLDAHAELNQELLVVGEEDGVLPTLLPSVEAEPEHELDEINRTVAAGGSYPADRFESERCNFSLAGQYDFKHRDWSNNHTHVAFAHTSYVAIGADIGDATTQFCAKYEGDNQCNAPYVVAQGRSATLSYDSGETTYRVCKSCVFGYCIACKFIVVDHVSEVRQIVTGVSSNERMHDCGQFRQP